MHHTPTTFETAVMDMLCTVYAVEASYRTSGKRKQSLLLSSQGKEEGRRSWMSHECPQELIQRLQLECQSRGLFAHALTSPAKRPLMTTLKNVIFAYKHRRIGRAIFAHRSAKDIVACADGYGQLYADVTRQLTTLSLTIGAGLGEIRRVEKYAKYVRLSAKHELVARALEDQLHEMD